MFTNVTSRINRAARAFKLFKEEHKRLKLFKGRINRATRAFKLFKGRKHKSRAAKPRRISKHKWSISGG